MPRHASTPTRRARALATVTGALAAAAVLTGTLALAGNASADDALPLPGSEACAALVNADATVAAAQAAVDTAGTAATTTQLKALADLKVAAQGRLCATVDDDPTTTPTSTSSSTATSTSTSTSTPRTSSSDKGSGTVVDPDSGAVSHIDIDDPSTASTSGRQVTQVPVGSADTGDGSTAH